MPAFRARDLSSGHSPTSTLPPYGGHLPSSSLPVLVSDAVVQSVLFLALRVVQNMNVVCRLPGAFRRLSLPLVWVLPW